MSTEEFLPPNYSKLDVALRSIGYSFEVAVADIIDNAIDEQAKNVLVRLIVRKDGLLDLAVWDDGHGMTAKTLQEAMRFGADVSDELDRLGKFGLGLKLASLSQAKELKVITRKNAAISGRAWLEQGIADGFKCTVFDSRDCNRIVSDVIPDRGLAKSGTLVLWSHLYRVGHHHGGAQEHAQKLMHALEKYLPIAFHRFLSGRPRKVRMAIDIFDSASKKRGLPSDLDPLDPFGYGQSGHRDFPATLHLHGAYKDRISVRAHIWPPNSTAAEYKLPGGANSRQGFYFYRNHRVIQGGGWNGIREVEPHSSLARLEVDISPSLDVDVHIDVKKVEIQLPISLTNAIQKASSTSGIDFKKYLSIADETYRTRRPTEAELPLIPSAGLPSDLTAFLHKELRLEATAKHRDLKFVWADLGADIFFDIDREKGCLYLNRNFRKQLLHGLSGSATDVPVMKCLLFMVLEDALLSERSGPKIRKRVERVNRILVEAVRYERSKQ